MFIIHTHSYVTDFAKKYNNFNKSLLIVYVFQSAPRRQVSLSADDAPWRAQSSWEAHGRDVKAVLHVAQGSDEIFIKHYSVR